MDVAAPHEDCKKELKEKVRLLELKLKHLENDYAVTREEHEATTRSYLEMLSNLEKVVNERTRNVKDVQTALGRQGRELQHMLDAVPAIIFLKDSCLRYVRVNEAFCRLAGLSRDDIVGRTDAELRQDWCGFDRKLDSDVVRKGKDLLQRRESAGCGGQQQAYLLDRLSCRDAAGNLTGFVGYAVVDSL
ncbi:MAG: PAS domain-containing protein [Deltaproteobacteria bacterium]|nr:PAS domain-containing protein [Deltaproteobacteria bacterium]